MFECSVRDSLEIMNSSEIRQKFLKYFKERGHKIVPSSSLIPDDPSVLLTAAGMQQFKPYFVGKADPQKDFGSLNTASIQKCFRTSDIDEIGDESHLTFFEMLGNFSFGGYFKREAIQYAYEFITKICGLTIDYVSVFRGDQNVPEDTESAEVWKSLGVTNIKKFGREDNFWGPTGSEGPCGPTTEVYVNSALRQAQDKPPVEVWNLVFNEYYQNADKSLRRLETPGVDTGMGLERLVMVMQNKTNIFETDLFEPLITFLDKVSDEKTKRVIADHARGISFLISDGVRSSNKEAGYVLRRLSRRLFGYEKEGILDEPLFEKLVYTIGEFYGEFYRELDPSNIIEITKEERSRFSANLENMVKNFTRTAGEYDLFDKIDGKMEWRKKYSMQTMADFIFKMYESYGSPFEVTLDMLKQYLLELSDENLKILRNLFDESFVKHQEISRAGAEKKFGGHGLILDTGELKAGSEEELKKVTRLHTATHLLQQALRHTLGNEVHQAGSDITAERTRFDFTFSRKLTPEEIKKVEDEVNDIIKKDLPMQKVVLPKAEAEKTGALYFFREKYPDPVNVYFVGKSIEDAYSKEFCGGPHVERTSEIGAFKIIKEEAVAAGTRRIRGAIE